MAQNNNRGGSSNRAQPMSNNEQMSNVDKLNTVLKALAARREEIEAVLPVDLPFDRFHATVNQALRNNPDIFKATVVSIINACVKAGYDGCRLDGREAALVLHSVKVGKNPDRWEDQAQYFPMVFGIVQQILRGGEVLAIDVDVIRENDKYQVSRGTNAEIIHYPELIQPRGGIVAAYSVATLKSGLKVTCLMTKLEIEDVKQEAKTKFVWNRWEGEMSKKSVVRRHRKMLPLGDRDIVDVEATEMFPQFNQSQPALAAPPKPTRDQGVGNAILGDSSGTSAGAALAFGNQGVEREGELIDVKSDTGATTKVSRNSPDCNVEAAATATKDANQQQKGKAVDASLPEDDAAWGQWAVDVEKRINAAGAIDDIRTIETLEKGRIDAANEGRRDFIKSLITDRLADLASEAAAGTATGGEE